ncbi:MAG: ABC transporter ATP-binding protein [Bacteroidetes bacterium]|nr:ABC transporter ATP-binding protein [Bacteroidota bacterium]MBU1421966.1 ABC transporter ATP-binding protein [Bacteroidota bacterium]MBU2636534.1 ABC transporter ATP-binding protein [Bacteroidota bacterium]
MSSSVIEATGLSKKFGELTVLSDIFFDVRRSEIFSIVGPDGAGKSTLIRILCGILRPNSGELKILGFDTKFHRKEIKHNIGYLSQRFTLYGDLTVDENIDFFAGIHREKDYSDRKKELLEFTQLTQFKNRLAEYLSGGMKQKLALVCTLIHRPQIIFLDEPTTGVDPVSRRDFWKILSALLKTGITIFLATPYLDEAERCNRVALMNKGKILVCDKPNEIRALFKRKVIEVVTDDVRRAFNILKNADYLSDVQMFGDRLHVSPVDDIETTNKIMESLNKEQISLINFREIVPSMEDVFISLITNGN